MGDDAAANVLKRVRENNHAERGKRRNEMYLRQRRLAAELSNTELKDFTEDEIINAARIICSGPCDLKEKSLMDLKSAFLLNQCNMLSFMKVEGALHGLVKYLMCQHPLEQLLAAECCSNLSMGDSKTCFKLAKAASPYLITILQGLNHNLMNVCLLTIFNLSSSGEKTCELLYSQGILKVLMKTMKIPELQENTMKALISLTKNGSKYLTEAEVRNILKFILPHFDLLPTVQWLTYLLSSLPYVIPILIENDIPERIMNLLSSVQLVCRENIVSVTSLIRLLGNLTADPEGITAELIMRRCEMTHNFFKILSSSRFPHLSKEMFWCIGNILQHRNPEVQKKVPLVDFSWAGYRIFYPKT